MDECRQARVNCLDSRDDKQFATFKTMTFKSFEDSLRCNGFRISRGCDGGNWVLPDGTEVLHERSYWKHPRQVIGKILAGINKPNFNTHYWSLVTYKDRDLAKRDAKHYNAVVQKEFYCTDEDPYWFLIFSDWDLAVKYAFDNLKLLQESGLKIA